MYTVSQIDHLAIRYLLCLINTLYTYIESCSFVCTDNRLVQSALRYDTTFDKCRFFLREILTQSAYIAFACQCEKIQRPHIFYVIETDDTLSQLFRLIQWKKIYIPRYSECSSIVYASERRKPHVAMMDPYTRESIERYFASIPRDIYEKGEGYLSKHVS